MSKATVDYQAGCIAANLEEIEHSLNWLAWQVEKMSSEQVDAFDKLFDDIAGAAYRTVQQAVIDRQNYWTEQERLAKAEVVVGERNNAHDLVMGKPIWEVAEEIGRSVPEEDWAAVPRDASSNLDHYLHGAPKRAREDGEA